VEADIEAGGCILRPAYVTLELEHMLLSAAA
jgi:hypothetical protein